MGIIRGNISVSLLSKYFRALNDDKPTVKGNYGIIVCNGSLNGIQG